MPSSYDHYLQLYKAESGKFKIEMRKQHGMHWVTLIQPIGKNSEYALEAPIPLNRLNDETFRNISQMVERKLIEEIHKDKSKVVKKLTL